MRYYYAAMMFRQRYDIDDYDTPSFAGRHAASLCLRCRAAHADTLFEMIMPPRHRTLMLLRYDDVARRFSRLRHYHALRRYAMMPLMLLSPLMV